jgi:hypothetical protein
MRALKQWLLAPLVALFEGTWGSGAESCEYLARLKAVPVIDSMEDRRAA